MNGENEFGELLRECRKLAKFSQKDLARALGYSDGTMISRWEKRPESGESPLIPPGTIVQGIIDALASRKVPRERLEDLWKAAGYGTARDIDSTLGAIVSVVHDHFQALDTDAERNLFGKDLRSVVQFDHAHFEGMSAYDMHLWATSKEKLMEAANEFMEFTQSWILRNHPALGYSLYSDGKYSDAIDYYNSALAAARALKDRSSEGEILIKLGDAERRHTPRKWLSALGHYKSAQKIFRIEHNAERKVDCARRIAGLCLFQGQPRKALRLLTTIQASCEKTGDVKKLYKIWQHLSWAYDLIGDWSEASRLSNAAVQVVRRLGDDWELAIALRYHGDALRIQRKDDDAIRDYRTSLQILKSFESKNVPIKLHVGMVKLGLSKVYQRMSGHEGEALKYLNESLEEHKELGESFRLAQILLEQAELLMRFGDFAEAENRLNQAIDSFELWGNQYYYLMGLAILCELYFKWKRYDSVLQTAATAMQAKYEFSNYQVAMISLVVGKTLIAQEKYEDAAEAFFSSSMRAIDFNAETFSEVQNEIESEVDRIALEVDPRVAREIVGSYADRIDNSGQKITSKSQYAQLPTKLRDKQNRIVGLEPVTVTDHLSLSNVKR